MNACRLLFALPLLCLTAAAQVPFSCTSDVPNPRTVRAEGKTELVADVVVTCTGGAPTPYGVPIPAANFTLTFNAGVTSRILAAGNRSEALLLLDEPPSDGQYPCTDAVCISFGNGEGGGYYGPTIPLQQIRGNSNVYDGAVGKGSAANSVTWANIPVDEPGPDFSRIFRFTNVRLDASTVTGGALRLTAITVAGQTPVTAIGGPLTVAAVQRGLAVETRDASNSAAVPNGINVTLAPAGSAATRTATLRFATQFNGAARLQTIAVSESMDAPAPPAPQDITGAVYDSESGFYNPAFPTMATGSSLARAGLADWGTRLMATFANVPANVSVYVALRNDGAGLGAPVARLIASDANGGSAFSAVAGNGTYALLNSTNGTATAVWEVLQMGRVAQQNYDFGVFLSYPAGVTSAPPPITVKMSYAARAGGVPVFADATGGQTLAYFTGTAPPLVPSLSVTPSNLTFTGTAGGQNPPAQVLSVTATPASAGYGVAGGGILPLNFQPAFGVTPGTTMVWINTRGLASGTYADTIRVSGPTLSPVQIPVTLTLVAGPAITGLSPSSLPAGSPGFTLTVSGTNLQPGTLVLWNGSPVPTTFQNAGQLTAQISATPLASARDVPVTARTPDGATSGASSFSVVPFTLTDISPRTVPLGAAGYILTASGSGFQPGATLNIGTTPLAAATFSSTRITATVPASAIGQAGPLAVTVVNPGGFASNALTVTVIDPLMLTRITPEAVTATGPGFVLNLTGTGFATGAVVQIGSVTIFPSSVSRTQLVVNVPAELIAQPGPLAVRVVNSTSESSGAVTLMVNAAPRITLLSPPSATAGDGGLVLTVTGTGFTSGSVIRWNGEILPATFVSTTQLTAPIGDTLLARPGPASVSVLIPGGVSSNAQTFTVNSRPLSLLSVSPASVPAGSGALLLSIEGSDLPQGSTVLWQGHALPTAFGSESHLTAQVPDTLLNTAGPAQILVVSPEGAVSNPMRVQVVLPPLPELGLIAPSSAPSGQDQTITLDFGGTYPVDLTATLTLLFTPEDGLPNDPGIQFQNGERTLTFTIPAGSPAHIPPILLKTGTVAGVITIAAKFTPPSGDNLPGDVPPIRIAVGRTPPSISAVTCTRTPSGFTVVIDGYTNTREATQAMFDFTAASGASLGTSQLLLQTGSLFSSWFTSSGADGGVFRYTQPFTVNGSSTSIAGVTVRLGNAAGASTSASCQLQ